jgi:hypothetical protein
MDATGCSGPLDEYSVSTLGGLSWASSAKRIVQNILPDDNFLPSVVHLLDKRIILVVEGLLPASMLTWNSHPSGRVKG